MRWAFWRRGGEQEPDAPHAPAVTPDSARDVWPTQRRDGDEQQDRPAAPACSGAAPFSGATPGWAPALEPGEFEDIYPPEALFFGLAGVRSLVVELVRAALALDAATVVQVLQRFQEHEADLELAPMVAATGLGPRLLAAADLSPEGGVAPAAMTAALARGDALVAGAEDRRLAVAPHCPPGLLRYVVRDALGQVDIEAPPAELFDAEDDELLLASAVLLAQTCADGQGDPTALELELAELLPDA
jgi:hypothetical protein